MMKQIEPLKKNKIEHFNLTVYVAENGLQGILLAKEIKLDLIIKIKIIDGYEKIEELNKDDKTKSIPAIASTVSLINVAKKSFYLPSFLVF